MTPLWQRGVTCLREAPPAKVLYGGQALRRRQGGDFPINVYSIIRPLISVIFQQCPSAAVNSQRPEKIV
jgi:hypothetical protein